MNFHLKECMDWNL